MGGLVRRICSLADGKRSTADIHTELKNAEGARNESAALTNKMLFKHVCLFVYLQVSVHLYICYQWRALPAIDDDVSPRS